MIRSVEVDPLATDVAGFGPDLLRSQQQDYLGRLLADHADTVFGQHHGLRPGMHREGFRDQVPIRDYEEMRPWLARVQGGEAGVVTSQPVTHLHPTSGTSGGAKLIPYTHGLQQDFQRGIRAWMLALERSFPGVLDGPGYWVITPPIQPTQPAGCVVPVRFSQDWEYLPPERIDSIRGHLVLPQDVERGADLQTTLYATLLSILATRGLRMISLWSPTFLTSLLARAHEWGDRLVRDLESGQMSLPSPAPETCSPPDPRRAREVSAVLSDSGTPDWARLFPELRVISCWTEGASSRFVPDLRALFPGVPIQPKGLLSTEGFVSYPDDASAEGGCLLASESHFFEFVCTETAQPFFADELVEGRVYTVILTTRGGLYRYNTHDRVRVESIRSGFPYMSFRGRGNCISDLVGEKLQETFLDGCVDSVSRALDFPNAVRFVVAMAKPAPRYLLVLQREHLDAEQAQALTRALDSRLREDHHYGLARSLGQLSEIRSVRVSPKSLERIIRQMSKGRRLGDLKIGLLQTDPTPFLTIEKSDED